MNAYEFILFMWISTLTAFLVGKALAQLGEVPDKQKIVLRKDECIFKGACSCPGNTCFSNFATTENQK